MTLKADSNFQSIQIDRIDREWIHSLKLILLAGQAHSKRSIAMWRTYRYVHVHKYSNVMRCGSRTQSTEICKLRPNYKLINVLRMTRSKTTWFYDILSMFCAVALEGKQISWIVYSPSTSIENTLWMREITIHTAQNWAWS